MSLAECKAKHTWRQYKAWQRWLDERMNRPGVLEHYLMQIASEVRRIANAFMEKKLELDFKALTIRWTATTEGNPAEVDLNEMTEADLEELDQEEIEQLKEQAAKESKARWSGFGFGKRRKASQ